jgi:peptidyl-prolyl cis-trans isomerase A (cyclophilin A)
MMTKSLEMRLLAGGLVATALGLAACGGESTASTEQASTSTPEVDPNAPVVPQGGVGQTEDGTQIIFAGNGPNRPAERRAYDPDRIIRVPNAPDPEAGDFTLDEAVAGMPTDGQLVVELGTDFGALYCDLYADRTPRTVANFVGLVRGLRPWWDGRAGQWVTLPYYHRFPFHRVIPGYIIQGGDHLEDGTGTVGYTMEYEPHDTLRHDRAGMLALATMDGPNSGGGQIYITDGPQPQLDGTATVFGHCIPESIVSQIARVPQVGAPTNRPTAPFVITRAVIRRVAGGAAAALPPPPPTRTLEQQLEEQGRSVDEIQHLREQVLREGTPRPGTAAPASSRTPVGTAPTPH